ncbi:hypothetical protein B7988_05395 [Fibrobacter sp. UWB1]|nr:hypothetical protein B7988_05395 [Fibrobacter sp. UWB1]
MVEITKFPICYRQERNLISLIALIFLIQIRAMFRTAFLNGSIWIRRTNRQTQQKEILIQKLKILFRQWLSQVVEQHRQPKKQNGSLWLIQCAVTNV